MDWLSNCVEGMHSRWLATSMSCCFSRLPERPEQELPGTYHVAAGKHGLIEEALEKYKEICHEQPQSIPPPRYDSVDPRPPSRSSHHPSQWMAEGRNLASRASSRASRVTRRSVSRRPTIGTPYDFKRVELPSGRAGGFRPLQLSIYLPGNELEPLPAFDEELEDLDLAQPTKALVKSRSESILSRPSTSFTIPRKPVASRSLSMDGSRFSVDGRYTSSELNPGRPRGPSVATSQSTQEFLDALDARLPQSPPLLRSRSGPEPVYTLYRRASEQSLRLRTHLEERQQVENRLQECDTILEEKQDDGNRGLSPISSHDSPIDALPSENVLATNTLCRPNTPSPPPAFPLPPLPTTESSPSFNLPIQAPSPLPLHPQTSKTDLLPTKIYTPVEPPSVRARISQWLMRAASQSSPNFAEAKATNNGACERPSTDRASTASSIYTITNGPELASPWTTPRSSPHRKKSSLSSCHFSLPDRGMSFDLEKHPEVTEVGCAF